MSVLRSMLAAAVLVSIGWQPAAAATVEITIQNLAFTPAAVTLKAGDTIRWVNKDALLHTATARNGAFDVKLPAHKTVTSVVRKAGTLAYYCRYHPNMTGTLTVSP